MNGKGQNLRIVIAAILALASSSTYAKSGAIDSIGSKTRPSYAVITGSDVITGGDRQKVKRAPSVITGSDVITGGDRLALKNAIAIGPIDSIDASAGTLKVLGQTYSAGADRTGALEFQLRGGVKPLVAIIGKPGKGGTLAANSMLMLADSYVAGATRVFLKGKVASLDSTNGKLTIGKQVVDYSAVVGQSDATVAVGAVLTVIGTQPVAAGEVLAETVR